MLKTAASHMLSGRTRPAGERHAYIARQTMTLCGLRLGFDVHIFPEVLWGEQTIDTTACQNCEHEARRAGLE